MINALVTGGCGFVGHHLVEHILKNTDWNVFILDRLSYAASLSSVSRVEKVSDIKVFKEQFSRVSFVWHDLVAPLDSIHHLIPKIDYVFHLAAESHVDRSLKDSRRFVQSQCMGVSNLLEYLKEYHPQMKKLINFSTDEVYGPAPYGTYFKEWDTMRPSNPYAAAKAGQDMIAFSFAHAFKIPIVIVRSMNIFGERQNIEKFVPKTLKAVLRGGEVVLHGSEEHPSSRFWIHARNVADSLLFLMNLETKPGEMFHIVGEEKTVLDIYKIITAELGIDHKSLRWVDFHSCRPGHDLRYALDGTKIKQAGWVAPLDFETSFRKLIHWYLQEENSIWLR